MATEILTNTIIMASGTWIFKECQKSKNNKSWVNKLKIFKTIMKIISELFSKKVVAK